MSGKKILVVDDSASVRQQVTAALSGHGFEVVEAVDGIDGIKRLTESSDYAAIVCDINMPRMSGLEMVEKLRDDGKSGNVPILMLTTEGQAALMQRAKQAGAKGWMIKPFKPEMLLATLRKLAT